MRAWQCVRLFAASDPPAPLHKRVCLAVRGEWRPESWGAIDRLDTPGTPPKSGTRPWAKLSRSERETRCNGLSSDTLFPGPLFIFYFFVSLFCLLPAPLVVAQVRHQTRTGPEALPFLLHPSPSSSLLPSLCHVAFLFCINEVASAGWRAGRQRGRGVVDSSALAQVPVYKVKTFPGPKGTYSFCLSWGK